MEALLEMTSVDELFPESMASLLWRVAGKERGLLYAKRAMSVKPARRKVRSAVVVREPYRYGRVDGTWRTDFQGMGAWVPVC